LYAAWKDSPTPVDLDDLWKQLGVRSAGKGIEFGADAPLAKVREAIASDPPRNGNATTAVQP
jgi:hypothetical protein